MLYHSDAICNGTDKLAKVATHTFILFNCIGVVRLAIREAYGLMRRILASNITKTTVDAFILVDAGNMMIVNIKIFPVGKGGNRPADEIINGGKAFFVHPVVEPFTEVFN